MSDSPDQIRAQIKAELAAAATERDAGVLDKYRVRRNDDPTGKHDDCWFFVLDIQHDPLARIALAAYKDAASKAGYATLAADLGRRLDTTAAAGDEKPVSCADRTTGVCGNCADCQPIADWELRTGPSRSHCCFAGCTLTTCSRCSTQHCTSDFHLCPRS